MSTPVLHIRGAEPTIIDHEPCGLCPTSRRAVTYNTAVPDRNLYVMTWYSWEFEQGDTSVYRLGEKRCEHCAHDHYTPRTGAPTLYQRRYSAESHVTRGGLLEAHENAVVLAVQNRLPLGHESLLMRSNHGS